MFSVPCFADDSSSLCSFGDFNEYACLTIWGNSCFSAPVSCDSHEIARAAHKIRCNKKNSGQRADRGVLKEAECSFEVRIRGGRDGGVGMLLKEAACIKNWLVLRIPLLAVFARRDNERVGVAGGRAIRMDLNNADVAFRELLRVHSTCCLLD